MQSLLPNVVDTMIPSTGLFEVGSSMSCSWVAVVLVFDPFWAVSLELRSRRLIWEELGSLPRSNSWVPAAYLNLKDRVHARRSSFIVQPCNRRPMVGKHELMMASAHSVSAQTMISPS